jgi:EEF1A N-terminal glycine/lysine methyltransferase
LKGHLLWNAGRVTAQYLEENAQDLVKDKCVLELGAGAGLPSLVCASKGAKRVVVTDYPEPELIDNLQYNIDHCEALTDKKVVLAEGYLWGDSSDKLRSLLCDQSNGFDLLILADILFNHSEHKKLVASLQSTLKKSAESRALVFFTPYRPWLLEKDLKFFEFAKEADFQVHKLFEKVLDKVMFYNDPGDELLRRTVFGYEVRWIL